MESYEPIGTIEDKKKLEYRPATTEEKGWYVCGQTVLTDDKNSTTHCGKPAFVVSETLFKGTPAIAILCYEHGPPFVKTEETREV